MTRVAAVGVLLGAIGCAPTLSLPRGEAHLAAMARGAREVHHGRHRDGAAAYADAATHAERRVDRDEAQYRQARALMQADDSAAALVLLDEIASREPESRRTVRARFDAARIRFANETTKAAGRAGLERVIFESPGTGLAVPALRLLVADRVEQESRDAALTWLGELRPRLATTELDDDILMMRARMFRDAGDRAAARRELDTLIAAHPYPFGELWDQAHVMHADMAEEDGAFESAIEHLEAIAAVYEPSSIVGSYTLPAEPRALLRAGRLHRDRRHDLERARDAFMRLAGTFRLSVVRDDALLEAGEIDLQRGDVSSACSLFAQVLREYEVGHARRRALPLVEAHCPEVVRERAAAAGDAGPSGERPRP